MDKRVITAIILSTVLLFFYPYILNYFNPPQKARQTAEQQAKPAAPVAPGTIAQQGAAPAQPAAAPAQQVKEELTTVETPLFKAVFSNLGGGVKSFELKNFKGKLDKEGKPVNISENIAKPGSFKTQIDANGALETVVFQANRPNITIGDKETAELILTGASSTGLKIQKKYAFSADKYIITTELTTENPTAAGFNGSEVITLLANVAGKDKSGYHQGPIIYTKDILRQTEKEFQKTGSEKVKWIGLEDKYFLSAVITKTDIPVNWLTEVSSVTAARAALSVPLSLGPNQKAVYTYNTFMGPKEYDLLVKQKIGLEDAIEFGWFGFMAKPFLVVLNFFERYLGNYGLAIIILTVLIKIIFYPLTKHSLKSMRDMQKIQPQMAALKEKYKDNKEKLNKEMMDLYKRYKINPLGGCLPMVLQIPVFIALYEVLYVAIELRHAPLFLWIRDLSDKDPYYITPLIMGATMFIQQKMTPTSVDPSQAKIMLIMPVVFTFMFLNFPSGLVLYWLVNNVLSIVQQYYIQRTPSKA